MVALLNKEVKIPLRAGIRGNHLQHLICLHAIQGQLGLQQWQARSPAAYDQRPSKLDKLLKQQE
jgi:hypothetical protein